jgi:hypothetical protein
MQTTRTATMLGARATPAVKARAGYMPNNRISALCWEAMGLLELAPPAFGIRRAGIYVLDDDGPRVCAGAFDTETAAIAWLERRQRHASAEDMPGDT